MSKRCDKKKLNKIFELNETLEILRCPRCKNTESFSTSTTAIAVATVNKNRELTEIRDLLLDFEQSLWQCDKCNCVFDEYGDIVI